MISIFGRALDYLAKQCIAWLPSTSLLTSERLGTTVMGSTPLQEVRQSTRLITDLGCWTGVGPPTRGSHLQGPRQSAQSTKSGAAARSPTQPRCWKEERRSVRNPRRCMPLENIGGRSIRLGMLGESVGQARASYRRAATTAALQFTDSELGLTPEQT